MNTFSILGDIVADETQRWYSSDVAPKQVIDWLSHQSGDVEITINSLGGSVVGGLAIANALRAYNRGKVIANVLGVAASMASVIACAAAEIRMGKGAFLMIHNPWSIAMGDADELRKEAATLDAIKASIISHYQTKFDKTEEEIAALMDAETWIAIESAAEYGLAATEYEPQTGDGYRAAAKLDSRLKYGKVPEGALAHIAHMGISKPAEVSNSTAEAPAAEATQEAAEASASEEASTPTEETATPQSEAGTPTEETTADAPATPPAEEPQNAVERNWQARLAGLQAAKDKEIAALRNQLSEAQNAHNAALETLKAENAKTAQALADAQAECKQLRDKVGAVTKDLEAAQAALATSEERYRDHIGVALAPPAAGGSEAASNWRSAYREMRQSKNSK